MKTFQYKAKEGPQKVIEGRMQAQNRDQVAAHLTNQGLFPLEIVPINAGSGDKSFFRSMFQGYQPSLRDKIAFLDQLADLAAAGLTLLRSLELISRQPQSPAWQKILNDIKESIREGRSFSEALEKHPLVFSRFIVSMIRSGEHSGTFDVVLREIAQTLEREDELKSRIKQSLIYPGIILSFGLVTILVLLTFVIPRLEELYEDFGGTLPWITMVVIGISRILLRYWWGFALVLAAGFLYIRTAVRQGHQFLRNFLRRLPWAGRLLELEDMTHFTRTLGLLLKHGIPVLEGLSVSGDVVQDRVLREKVALLANAVSHGRQMAASMEELGVFSAIVVNFVQTGEETGTLDAALEKISRSHEKEIEQRIKILTTLLEPLLILIIGVLVGIIVVSMLLPIFQISMLVH